MKMGLGWGQLGAMGNGDLGEESQSLQVEIRD